MLSSTSTCMFCRLFVHDKRREFNFTFSILVLLCIIGVRLILGLPVIISREMMGEWPCASHLDGRLDLCHVATGDGNGVVAVFEVELHGA